MVTQAGASSTGQRDTTDRRAPAAIRPRARPTTSPPRLAAPRPLSHAERTASCESIRSPTRSETVSSSWPARIIEELLGAIGSIILAGQDELTVSDLV